MKGILVLGLLAALAVAPGGSLDCPQCSSFDSSCDGSVVSECPADASTSCVVSYAGWPAASPPTGFQNLACSDIDAALLSTTRIEALVSFYVRVADGETAWLSSRICNGGPCNSISPSPPGSETGWAVGADLGVWVFSGDQGGVEARMQSLHPDSMVVIRPLPLQTFRLKRPATHSALVV
nr:ly6/PLAUR domain-containing protein 8 [Oryctolagus cuniculus]